MSGSRKLIQSVFAVLVIQTLSFVVAKAIIANDLNVKKADAKARTSMACVPIASKQDIAINTSARQPISNPVQESGKNSGDCPPSICAHAIIGASNPEDRKKRTC